MFPGCKFPHASELLTLKAAQPEAFDSLSAVLAKYDTDVTEKFVTRTEVAMLLANTTKPEALLLHALTVEKDKSEGSGKVGRGVASPCEA